MITWKVFPKKGAYSFFILIYISTLFFGLSNYAQAAELQTRSVSIGTAVAEATTNHDFSFGFVTTDVVGSIVLEYCENSPLFDQPCVVPSGLDVSGASLASQSGETGFSVHANTNTNTLVISRTPSATSVGPAEYGFSNIVNPDTPNKTTYVRVSTHAADDGSGSNVDEGSVAFSLAANLAVSAFVPPYITLCVGVNVGAKCATSSGSGVNLGNLSPSQTRTGTTQFAVATNDESGYTLSSLGTTMTSGNNAIPALGSPSFSRPGVGQFGINLKNNSSPNVGKNKSGAGSAFATSGYNQTNRFKFKNGEIIARANNATNFNRFTVSYIVNVPDGQSPGFYSTTLTYAAFASF